MQTRAAALAALLILGTALSGCEKASQTDAPATADPYAGLEAEILKWRGEIVKTDALCQSHAEGQKCDSFEVVCKAQRAITPAEAAKGVTAKLVAGLNWNGFDTQHKQTQSVLRAAQFTRAHGVWTRAEHTSVNPESCADL